MLISNSNLSWVIYKKLNPEFQILEDAGITFSGRFEEDSAPAQTPSPVTGLPCFNLYSGGWQMCIKENNLYHFLNYGHKEKLLLSILVEIVIFPVEDLVKYLPSEEGESRDVIDRAVAEMIKLRLGETQ